MTLSKPGQAADATGDVNNNSDTSVRSNISDTSDTSDAGDTGSTGDASPSSEHLQRVAVHQAKGRSNKACCGS
jgi:hypothetical protein